MFYNKKMLKRSLVGLFAFLCIGLSNAAPLPMEYQEPTKPETPAIVVTGNRGSANRTVTLSCATEGVKIYRDNGSEMSEYASPYTLSKTSTLKTWAETADGVKSDIVETVIYVNDPLSKPVIAYTKVNGASRVVSITAPNTDTQIEYWTAADKSDLKTYTSELTYSANTTVYAIQKYNDLYAENEADRIVTSATSQFDVAAGTAIKLNTPTFNWKIHDLSKVQAKVELYSDTSSVLLKPSAKLVFHNETTGQNETLTNTTSTSVITGNGHITVYATAEGYEDSDPVSFDIKIQTISALTAPKIEPLTVNADGTRQVKISHTVTGYPTPYFKITLPGSTTELTALNDTVITCQPGWLSVYVKTDSLLANSPKSVKYIDKRSSYSDNYVAITPQLQTFPSTIGDLELWNNQELNIPDAEYPTTNFRVTGYIYYHTKVHANFNNLILPFYSWWSTEKCQVTDQAGNVLTHGTDYWIYNLNDAVSGENLANGNLLIEEYVMPNFSYLIKVKPELVGQELIFRSQAKEAFFADQSNNSASPISGFQIVRNRRYQTLSKTGNIYKLNDEGTAFVLNKNGETLDPYTSFAIGSPSFSLSNSSIDLLSRPTLSAVPVTGSTVTKIDLITLTATGYAKLELIDSAYLTGGSKSFNVKKDGTLVTTAQLIATSDNSYTLKLAQTQTADGIYTIEIPADIFYFYQTAGEVYATSGAFTLSYSILSELTVTPNPSNGSMLSELYQLKYTFSKPIALTGKGSVTVARNGTTIHTLGSSNVSISGQTLVVTLPSKETIGGSYKVTIPAGFLKINDSYDLPNALVYSYSIQVQNGLKEISADEIIMIDYDNLSAAYAQGWLTDGAGNNDFSITNFSNAKVKDPKTGTVSTSGIYGLKLGKETSNQLNIWVKAVDAIELYYYNSSSYSLYSYISGNGYNVANFDKNTSSVVSSITQPATVPSGSYTVTRLHLGTEKVWNLKLRGDVNNTYLYAIKLIKSDVEEEEDIPDLEAPSIQRFTINEDGNIHVKILKTTKDSRLKKYYLKYRIPGETDFKTATQDTMVICTPGWLEAYTVAEGKDDSALAQMYIDYRTAYGTTYTAVTPSSPVIPDEAGDLEFWNASEVEVATYPKSKVKSYGNIYFHKQMHAGYNILVVPFEGGCSINDVYDYRGLPLTQGEDIWIYELNSEISAEKLFDGTLLVSGDLDAKKAYLVKVKPEMEGKDLILKSAKEDYFGVNNDDFTVSSYDKITAVKCKRYQTITTNKTCYVLNASGTAFERKTGTKTIEKMSAVLFAPSSFTASEIRLAVDPEMTITPENGTTVNGLNVIELSVDPAYKLEVADAEYIKGGKKSIVVASGGKEITGAQFEKVDDSMYRLALSRPQAAEGRYTITIPSGVLRVRNNANATDAAEVGEKILEYDVVSDLEVTSDVDQTGVYTTLGAISFAFNKKISLNKIALVEVYKEGKLFTTLDISNMKVEDQSLVVVFPKPLTSSGTYTVVIKANTVELDNTYNLPNDLSFSYVIERVIEVCRFAEDIDIVFSADSLARYYAAGWLANGSGEDVFEIVEVGDQSQALKLGTESMQQIDMWIEGIAAIELHYVNPDDKRRYSNYDSRAYLSEGYVPGESELEHKVSQTFVIPNNSSSVERVSLDDACVWNIVLSGEANASYIYKIRLIKNDVTGITGIMNDGEVDGQSYDLNGVPAQSIERGKVYVKSGKRIIVK